jgi:hypothetical protein
MRQKVILPLAALILSAPFAPSFSQAAGAGGAGAARPTIDPAARRPLTGTLGLDVTMGLQKDARLAAALAEIDPARLRRLDSTLVGFGTRNTFSDTLSATRGIGAARRWIKSEFDSYSADCGGCLRVWFDDSVQAVSRAAGRTVNIVNVVAMLPGRDTTRVLVIGGHYDSCVCALNATQVRALGGTDAGGNEGGIDAPGANDDGSGTVAIMELARVFAKNYPRGLETNVIFVAHSSEELGLLGAYQLSRRLRDRGYTIVAGITNDIVGNVTAEDGTVDSTSVRIFAADPDNGPSRELGRYAWAAGMLYNPSFTVFPVWRLDRIGRGGDHRVYVEAGDAGLRVTERLENFAHQHNQNDRFEFVNFGYIANVARLDAAIVGSLAQAPAPPVLRVQAGSQGSLARMSWRPVPGAVSYEVVVRRTISPAWEMVIPVGDVTAYDLPRRADDETFGVRSVSAAGHRSLVASYPAPAAR